jgi:hypothetical protein
LVVVGPRNRPEVPTIPTPFQGVLGKALQMFGWQHAKKGGCQLHQRTVRRNEVEEEKRRKERERRSRKRTRETTPH